MFVFNVEAAIFRDGKWLVIQRSTNEAHAGGTISLVGGTVEDEGNQADILEKSLRREVFEEVGVELHGDLHYVHSTSFIADDGDFVVDVVFLSTESTAAAFVKSPDEVDHVYWWSLEEIMHNERTPAWTKESVERAAKVLHNLSTLPT